MESCFNQDETLYHQLHTPRADDGPKLLSATSYGKHSLAASSNCSVKSSPPLAVCLVSALAAMLTTRAATASGSFSRHVKLQLCLVVIFSCCLNICITYAYGTHQHHDGRHDDYVRDYLSKNTGLDDEEKEIAYYSRHVNFLFNKDYVSCHCLSPSLSLSLDQLIYTWVLFAVCLSSRGLGPATV